MSYGRPETLTYLIYMRILLFDRDGQIFKFYCHYQRLILLYHQIAHLGPVHMIPGQLITLGQLTDPGVNFASVHGLTPVTVHMSFSLPRGNFERRVTRCTTPGNPPCRGNFSPCEQNAKVAPGQE